MQVCICTVECTISVRLEYLAGWRQGVKRAAFAVVENFCSEITKTFCITSTCQYLHLIILCPANCDRRKGRSFSKVFQVLFWLCLLCAKNAGNVTACKAVQSWQHCTQLMTDTLEQSKKWYISGGISKPGCIQSSSRPCSRKMEMW